MYYWVNQGKTFKEEKEGGYLWAPVKNNQGQAVFHWENMTKLKPNEVVFNYRKGFLVGYCLVESKSYYAQIPKEFNVDVEWDKKGYMVDARYYMFKDPIPLKTVYEEVEAFLPNKYSPINKSGESIRANQGYLYRINKEIADRILQLAGIRYTVQNQIISTVQEDKIRYITPDSTTRKGLINSRIGQGEYRRNVLKRWNNRCAVSKISIKEILIASHIVPWREATDDERLDIHNGLLLSPVFDALFDRYLISFDDEGGIILSDAIDKDELSKLGITGKEKIEDLTEQNRSYLRRHREKLVKL